MKHGDILGGAYGYAGGKYYIVVRTTDKSAWVAELKTVLVPSEKDPQCGRTQAGTTAIGPVQRLKIHRSSDSNHEWVKPKDWTACDVTGGARGHEYYPD